MVEALSKPLSWRRGGGGRTNAGRSPRTAFMLAEHEGGTPSTDPITATLSIPSNDPDMPIMTIALNGSVCPSSHLSQPSISFSPTPLDFGIQAVGDSASLSPWMYIHGQTCGVLQIDTLQLIGPHASEFSLKNKSCYYGYLDSSYLSCSFDLVFSPIYEGQKEVEFSDSRYPKKRLN